MLAPLARLLLAATLLWVPLACNQKIEPYDPTEKAEKPDLSKIFPEAAEQSAKSRPPVMPAPGGGRGAPPAATGAEAPPIRGTIRLAPELEGHVPPNAILFLVLRSPAPGPPTAVKRIPAPHFPLAFRIGPDDRMLQAMPFSGPFRLSARVDADGNATTRTPGDLEGRVGRTLQPGDSGVELVIDQVL